MGGLTTSPLLPISVKLSIVPATQTLLLSAIAKVIEPALIDDPGSCYKSREEMEGGNEGEYRGQYSEEYREDEVGMKVYEGEEEEEEKKPKGEVKGEYKKEKKEYMVDKKEMVAAK